MAKAKKTAVKTAAPSMSLANISWKRFFIGLSFALNIGFIVVIITMMTSNSLDGMFMREGLTRYCASENDAKFDASTDEIRALRQYTCANGEARQYFDAGLTNYLNAKGIKS